MTKFIQGSSLLLYALSLIVFFIVGAAFAGVLDAGQGQGLAGGAIVLGYGLVTAFGAFLISLLVVHRCSSKLVGRTDWILFFIFSITVAIIYYRFEKNVKQEPPDRALPIATAPSALIPVNYPEK